MATDIPVNLTANFDGRVNPLYPLGDKPSGTLLASATFDGNVLDSGWTDSGVSYADNSVYFDYPDNRPSGSSTPDIEAPRVSTNGLNEVFIKLRAKKTSGGGSKFVKVYGIRTDGFTNYANCTFNLIYSSGVMANIIFGDGTGIANDAGDAITFSTGTTGGRNASTAVISCPNGQWIWPDEAYHEFKLHVKFNTGTTAENEVADGEFHVYIDGNLYASAKNLFNRHYSNQPIDYIKFLELSQNSAPFRLTMDDVQLSTGDWV